MNVQVLLRHTPSGSHWARVSLIFTLFVRVFPYLSTYLTGAAVRMRF